MGWVFWEERFGRGALWNCMELVRHHLKSRVERRSRGREAVGDGGQLCILERGFEDENGLRFGEEA